MKVQPCLGRNQDGSVHGVLDRTTNVRSFARHFVLSNSQYFERGACKQFPLVSRGHIFVFVRIQLCFSFSFLIPRTSGAVGVKNSKNFLRRGEQQAPFVQPFPLPPAPPFFCQARERAGWGERMVFLRAQFYHCPVVRMKRKPRCEALAPVRAKEQRLEDKEEEASARLHLVSSLRAAKSKTIDQRFSDELLAAKPEHFKKMVRTTLCSVNAAHSLSADVWDACSAVCSLWSSTQVRAYWLAVTTLDVTGHAELGRFLKRMHRLGRRKLGKQRHAILKLPVLMRLVPRDTLARFSQIVSAKMMPAVSNTLEYATEVQLRRVQRALHPQAWTNVLSQEHKDLVAVCEDDVVTAEALIWARRFELDVRLRNYILSDVTGYKGVKIRRVSAGGFLCSDSFSAAGDDGGVFVPRQGDGLWYKKELAIGRRERRELCFCLYTPDGYNLVARVLRLVDFHVGFEEMQQDLRRGWPRELLGIVWAYFGIPCEGTLGPLAPMEQTWNAAHGRLLQLALAQVPLDLN